MFQDEARFGLIRTLRSCWAPKGLRPELNNRLARSYTYAYGAVSPLDGKSDFLILPTMGKEAFALFLEELSKRYSDEHIALFLDGAASHQSQKVNIPKNISLILIPPYSPQLNPIENLWKVIRQRFFPNLDFDSMDDLEENLIDALLLIEDSPDLVKSATGYQWLLDILSTQF